MTSIDLVDTGNNIPNYCCESQEVSESVKNSATNAVFKLYQYIFHVSSKFSDIPFYPFKIDYDKHQIWIHSLGTSEDSNFLGAGLGYSSSFLYFYTKNKKKQRVLIWQTIDKDSCHIEIYCGNELLGEFHNKTPSTVWKNANFLTNADGIELFGLRNNITQDQLNNMHNLKCLPKDWKNELQMTKLYNHHLHKYTISAINWYSVFINWLDQSTIIELYSILEKIYPSNYNFSEREIRAWHAMFKATGVSNWGEWQWPNNGPYASHIRVRALPNFGTWKNFTSAQIAKVTKIILTQLAPQISEHSTPKNNASRLDLLNLLQKEMFFETMKELNERKNHLPINDIVLAYTTKQSFVSKWFLLDTGWVLKENQKYGKKGSGKRIAPNVFELLKAMFMAEMFDELSQMAKESILSPEEVPSKQTIQSWIG
ncbi:27092_t:CDS:2 [Dentiscutata erythropus]|uniref:27092_t:CDS:1 n=1 Tax=Dentiscutata erythropus TaxID=1348616 RepID=A0A9N9HF55_9GLOM|nr:27092_t:CDS:2 [Dentiscutata erythropus]